MSAGAAVEPFVGCQEPTTLWVPPGAVSSAAAEVLDLCESIGLHLDPWQRLVLHHGLAEAASGNWLAFEIVCIVARQNGKGAIIEALELGCLFLFGDRLIVHSAHEFKTAKDGFKRLNGWLTNIDWLRKRVRQVYRSNETVGFDLKTGQEMRFMARSSGSGRGFPVGKLFLDEALILQDTQLSAVMPALSAQPNPQLWYFSSAGPPVGKPRDVSQVLARLVRRGRATGDRQLVFAEYAAVPHERECKPGCVLHDDPADPRTWLKTNPGAGYRLSREAIEREYRSMSAEAFGRERLSIGDYPEDDGEGWAVIAKDAWQARAGAAERPDAPVAFAVAAAWPDADSAAIGVAGRRGDRLVVQVVEYRPGQGTGWVVGRVQELQDAWKPCAIAGDPGGPAGPVIAELKAAKVDVLELSMRDAAAAFGMFKAAFNRPDGTGAHFGQPELDKAVAAADRRPLADGFVWARQRGGADISPVEAVTVAVFAHATRATSGSTPALWSWGQNGLQQVWSAGQAGEEAHG